MMSLMMAVLFAVVPSPVPADGDMIGWLLSSAKWVVEQIQQGNYVAAVGVIILVLVWAFNKFLKDRLNPKFLPLISAVVATLGMCGLNLAQMVRGAPATSWLQDRKSTRLNSSHSQISYALFCLKKTTHIS